MKLKSLLLVVTLLFSLPVFTQAQTGAYGVSFDVPAGWKMTTETDPAWTKFRLRQDGGLPKVMVQIYSGHVAPVSVLDAYVTAHRTKYRENHWAFTESSTQETFGTRIYDGRQLTYTANGSNYCQRFYALTVNNKTVLVMSLVQFQEDWNYWSYANNQVVPNVLGPIAASLR